MLPPCGTFDYRVVVPDNPGEFCGSWYVEERTPETLTGEPLLDFRLLGPCPTVKVCQGRITLTASGKDRA